MRMLSCVALLAALAAPAAGCQRRPAARPPVSAARSVVDVRADSARGAQLVPARFDSTAFVPFRVRRALAPPLPGVVPPPAEVAPSEPPGAAVERLPQDERLRPPVLRPGVLPALPKLGWRDRGVVELDLYVDANGDVADARWAGGRTDSALVRAALRQASALRYEPATQAGRPVAVWCRQRFEAGR